MSPVATAVEMSSAVRLSRAMAAFSRASEKAVVSTPTTLPLRSPIGATTLTRSGSRRSWMVPGTAVTTSDRPRRSSAIWRFTRPPASASHTDAYSISSLRPRVASVSLSSPRSSNTTAAAHESADSRVTAIALSSLA